MTDPYKVLGISHSASDAEIRAAYRRQVQLHHPDHNGGSPVKFDITALAQGASLLYPYTTTMLEVFVEREPTPLGNVSTIFTFPQVV